MAKKSKPTKAQRLAKAQAEHGKFLARFNVKTGRARIVVKGCQPFPDLSVVSTAPPVSNRIPGGVAAKRNILIDHSWQAGQQAPKAEVDKAIATSKRIGVGYNKGGYQLLSEAELRQPFGKQK